MLKLFHYQLAALVHAHIARLGMLEENLVHMILKLSLNVVNKLLKKESSKFGLRQKTQVLMGGILGLAFLSY